MRPWPLHNPFHIKGGRRTTSNLASHVSNGRKRPCFLSGKKSFPLRTWNSYSREMPITKGKKNKRGARGSAEEENTCVKAPLTTQRTEWRSRRNRRGWHNKRTQPLRYSDLLVSIQRTAENILKENNKLSNKVGELNSSFRRLENELLATKNVLSDVQNTNKELRIELDAAKQQNEE